jgi:hypothetical protein
MLACLLGTRPAQYKEGVMLRTPGSPWSSGRRPCTLMQRLAAVRVVAQPDRQGQLGKADRGRVALVGWWTPAHKLAHFACLAAHTPDKSQDYIFGALCAALSNCPSPTSLH